MGKKFFGNEEFGMWKFVSDERLILQREIVPDETYEMVRIIKEPPGSYKLLHEVIFCNDYSKDALEEVLAAFGYKSLEEFLLEYSGQELADCDDIFELIDWGTLSMFICDTHDDGILMEEEEAVKAVKRITGCDICLMPR